MEKILESLNKLYNNEYEYIIDGYINKHSKIVVICKKHGQFKIRCGHHMSGQRCKECKKIIDGEIFIQKSNKIHLDKYDYSLVKYDGQKNKVLIVCKKHGQFSQVVHSHLSGSGCPKCVNELKLNIPEIETLKFINESIKKHNSKYDYSRCNYINSKSKVEIICRTHGSFKQIPGSHLKFNESCPKCRKLSKEKIVKISNKMHDNKYDYSNFIYDDQTTTKSNMKILCNKHGYFNQRISHHIRGTGCPICNESQGEKMINDILVNIGLSINIDFFRQQTFENLIDENQLFFDFYIPKYNLCIEFDGDQHFKPIKIFGGEKAFNGIVKRDRIKNEYCLDNNIQLFRFDKNKTKESIYMKIKYLMNF